ncbi:MAG: proprotein convertase P-domain-containing protein [Saprospiraceae bacterium]|nr:proprotein convertase P-domain-containing protein [Saprospiraceae bacterium]
MRRFSQVIFTLTLTILAIGQSVAQSTSPFWTFRSADWIQAQPEEAYVQPAKGVYANLDLPALREALPQGASGTMEIPGPDGELHTCVITWSPAAEAGYYERHPETATFRIKAVHEPTLIGRIDYTINGFHAMMRQDGRTWMIDPVFRDRQDAHAIYYQDEYLADALDAVPFTCYLEEEALETDPDEGLNMPLSTSLRNSPVSLKTYRIAIAATGEYTVWHGGKAAASAEIITAVNRLNSVLEIDMGVHLNLISNNDLIVFTDPITDGYTNGETDIMINQNPTVISMFIPPSSYDIGHVFGVATQGNVGLALLAAVCTNSKALGVSGLFTPKFDAFYIGVVAHEVGHQFAATHSFNKCINENPGTGWEPGSGSTIMSYAGSCGPNALQNNADAYYHGGSLGQMKGFVLSGSGAQCGTSLPTDNENPTLTVSYPKGINIPISTPFILEASAQDPNPDNLTYCWDGMDTGPITDAGMPLLTSPLFRSYKPVADSFRVFPKMYKVAQGLYDKFELLPTYSRDMTFRITVRDNNSEAGSINQKDVAFYATELAGPFEVTSFPFVDTVRQGDYVPITWDVANTDQYPVYCKEVSIFLSTDGGLTFPLLLAENVPNNGSFFVSIPQVTTTSARIMVRAADNIFFNMSSGNLRILPPLTPGYSLDVRPYAQVACVPNIVTLELETSSLLGFAEDVTFELLSGLPPGAIATFSPQTVTPPATTTFSINLSGVTQGGEYDLEIQAMANGFPALVRPAKLQVVRSDYSSLTAVDPPSGSSAVGSSPLLAWVEQEDAENYTVEVATSPAFGASTILVASGLTEPSYQMLLTLDANTLYFWRVFPGNNCGEPDDVPVFAFHTISLNCTDLTKASDISITNQGLSSVESPISIPNMGTVSEVRVQNIMGTHQSIGDLRGYLQSPSGTKVKLFSGKCAFIAGSINMGFNDESALPFNCPPSQGSIYASEEPLSAMSGEEIQGEWKLIIQDLAVGGGGKLTSWTLRLCTDVSLNNPILSRNDTLFLLPGATRTVSDQELLSEDPDNTPDELTYTLVTTPSRGILYLSGTPLMVGGHFSQADLDQGKVDYEDTSLTVGDDAFLFTVQDGEGGWFGIDRFPIRTSTTVSIKPLDPQVIGLDVFPNPASGELYLRLAGVDLHPDQILMSNWLGQTVPVHSISSGGGMTRLLVDQLPNGMYLISVRLPQGVATAKVQIIR